VGRAVARSSTPYRRATMSHASEVDTGRDGATYDRPEIHAPRLPGACFGRFAAGLNRVGFVTRPRQTGVSNRGERCEAERIQHPVASVGHHLIAVQLVEHLVAPAGIVERVDARDAGGAQSLFQ
jgi:hypothetical protein